MYGPPIWLVLLVLAGIAFAISSSVAFAVLLWRGVLWCAVHTPKTAFFVSLAIAVIAVSALQLWLLIAPPSILRSVFWEPEYFLGFLAIASIASLFVWIVLIAMWCFRRTDERN